MSRFDTKFASARKLYLEGRKAAAKGDEARHNPMRAYDLALLSEFEQASDADPGVARAEMWRRRLGAAVLVLLICGLAVLAGISGPEPVHPALLAAP